MADGNIPTTLEAQLRSEATSPEEFKAILAGTTPEGQLAAWRNLLIAQDLKITPALQEKIGLLYESTEREWDYMAQHELVTAASHAPPELYKLLYSLVTDEEARAEASKVVKKPEDASPAQLFEDMVIAIRNADVNRLEELSDHAGRKQEPFFNEGNAYGSKLILEAAYATDRASERPLPADARWAMISALTRSGAVPLPVKTEDRMVDPIEVLETDTKFPAMYTQSLEKTLAEHQLEHGLPRERMTQRKEHGPERKPLWSEEPDLKPKEKPRSSRGLATREKDGTDTAPAGTSRDNEDWPPARFR